MDRTNLKRPWFHEHQSTANGSLMGHSSVHPLSLSVISFSFLAALRQYTTSYIVQYKCIFPNQLVLPEWLIFSVDPWVCAQRLRFQKYWNKESYISLMKNLCNAAEVICAQCADRILEWDTAAVSYPKHSAAACVDGLKFPNDMSKVRFPFCKE